MHIHFNKISGDTAWRGEWDEGKCPCFHHYIVTGKIHAHKNVTVICLKCDILNVNFQCLCFHFDFNEYHYRTTLKSQ